jgi:hypothetical protein
MNASAHYNSILSNLKLLPEQLQIQVADYIQFLVLKHLQKGQTSNTENLNKNKISSRKLGVFKGKIKVPADFNDPIEDFKEY